MSPAEPCKGCGSGLDADQRYCVECGTRVGAPLAMPYAAAAAVTGGAAAASGGAATAAAGASAGAAGGFLSALPMPAQAAATCAALALGLGVVAGTALNPNLAGSLAGQTVVVEAPPEPEPAAPAPAPSAPAPAAPAVASAPAPVTTFSDDTGTTTTGGGGGGGGGGGKTPKEKPELISGVVIHQNTVASSYAVAPGSGGVNVIHTSKGLPAPGTQVKVPVRELANLTSAEDGKRQATGQVALASFSGIVTYNRDSTDPNVRDVYTVSNRGSSVLIHSPADVSVGTVNQPPPVGTVVRVSVEISTTIVETPTPPAPPANQPLVPAPAPPAPSCAAPATPFPNPPVFPPKSLYEKALAVEAPAADVDGSELESVVQAVCPATGQILLAGDDVREAGRLREDGTPNPDADLFDPTTGTVLTAGPGVSFAGFAPGQAVMANVTLAPAASGSGAKLPSVVTGIRDDTGISGADAAIGQGDLAP